jgi:hypothetical protein
LELWAGSRPREPQRQKVVRFVSHFVHVAAPNGKLPFLTVL